MLVYHPGKFGYYKDYKSGGKAINVCHMALEVKMSLTIPSSLVVMGIIVRDIKLFRVIR